MKAKVKATGKIVDGIPIYYGSEGKGYLDVPVDHDIFDRYDLEEVELLEQPSLPDGLEEAAEKYRRNSCNAAMIPNIDGPTPEYGGSVKDAFKAGAEWMAGQGYTQKYIVRYNEGVSDTSTQSRQMTFTMPVPNDFFDGDMMIVQIRKK